MHGGGRHIYTTRYAAAVPAGRGPRCARDGGRGGSTGTPGPSPRPPTSDTPGSRSPPGVLAFNALGGGYGARFSTVMSSPLTWTTTSTPAASNCDWIAAPRAASSIASAFATSAVVVLPFAVTATTREITPAASFFFMTLTPKPAVTGCPSLVSTSSGIS